MIKHCNFCDKIIDHDDKFCKYCHVPQETFTPKPYTVESSDPTSLDLQVKRLQSTINDFETLISKFSDILADMRKDLEKKAKKSTK